jgi:hypothetical protein
VQSGSATVTNIKRKVRNSEIITSLLVLSTLRRAPKFFIFVLMESSGGIKYLWVEEKGIFTEKFL